MIQLPSGSYCTELKVNPRNWKTSRNAIKKDWFIYYRLYDPNKLKNKKGRLVIVKGMNHLNDLETRITKTKELMSSELIKLRNTKLTIKTVEHNTAVIPNCEITTETPFIEAIRKAEKIIHAAPSTKRDLQVIMNLVENSATQLGYSHLPISVVKRKNIKLILLHINETRGDSSHRYNKIRTYLMMIYAELVELELFEANPLREIRKRKTIRKIRSVLSKDSRILLNDYLEKNYYRFWLFMQIFFHSGSRISELMIVKKNQVDLIEQIFRVVIKKGTKYVEIEKPIKNIALKYWKVALENADSNDYLFSKGLLPGPTPIQSYQITKRWYRLVKLKLGIKEDFYSLKHLNLDETAARLDLSNAALMASHTSPHITLKNYAVNEIKRQYDRLRKVDNEFSGLKVHK